MSFEDKVRKYYIVGEKYSESLRNIESTVICTGFTRKTNCRGNNCSRHTYFGRCDGTIKPTFDKYPEGHCAYEGSGMNWFATLETVNCRW